MSCSDTQSGFTRPRTSTTKSCFFITSSIWKSLPDEQPGTQEALRILEKLTIVGRDKQPVPNSTSVEKGSTLFSKSGDQHRHSSSQKLSGKR